MENNVMMPKVREWLEERGFTLEMRAASAFRAAGFEVRQSSTYVDAATQKDREIDALAIDPDVVGVVEIQFVVECKRIKKPWVLLSSPDTLMGYHRVLAFAAVSEEAKDVLSVMRDLDQWPWMTKKGLIGYSVREAFSDKDNADIPFAAASSVASACNSFTRRRSGRYEPPIRIAFPVIVIDGVLVRGSLAENGDVELQEVEDGEFLFFFRDRGSCIRIVTANRVAEFAKEAKRVADFVRAKLKSEQQRVIDSWKNDTWLKEQALRSAIDQNKH